MKSLKEIFRLTPKEYDEIRVRHLRKDEAGDPGGRLDVGHWVGLVISALVLVIVIGALWSTLTTYLSRYAANETTFGPTLKTLVPILIGVGILLAYVTVFLPRMGYGRKG